MIEQILLCDLSRCDIIKPVPVVIDPLVKTRPDHAFDTAVMFSSFDSNVDVVSVEADVQLVSSPRNVGLVHAGTPSVDYTMMRDHHHTRKP